MCTKMQLHCISLELSLIIEITMKILIFRKTTIYNPEPIFNHYHAMCIYFYRPHSYDILGETASLKAHKNHGRNALFHWDS